MLGGFSLLSWLGAFACLATVALLLRRGSAVTAAIAIIAVPFIAYRTVPRSELFAVVLFAAYLSLLWENYQTGRAPLWWLPLLMVVWVNVHVSFFSGLGLLVGFAGLQALEQPWVWFFAVRDGKLAAWTRPSPQTLTGWRRHLHAHPELSRHERDTAAFVCARLAELGIPFVAGVGGHGVVATLSRGLSNRSVGLRADMDALPITETTALAATPATSPGKPAC